MWGRHCRCVAYAKDRDSISNFNDRKDSGLVQAECGGMAGGNRSLNQLTVCVIAYLRSNVSSRSTGAKLNLSPPSPSR